ncbi:MAG TPA: GNAT family N-acetyltransferase [Rhizomicrobium sp.]|nr:GNAT family N-acetyltransferase [Rhizomicrobium sp.]
MTQRHEITFRPLVETDFKAFTEWLNRPHLRRFFQKKPTTETAVAAYYGPSVRGETPTHCHLALLDGQPFGYLQCYRIAAYPAWAATIGETDGIGVDLLIFEPDMIGKGLGSAMLTRYLRDVAFALFPDERRCFIGHEHENVAGWRNSESVGFRFVRDFVEDGAPSRLLMLERGEMAESRG